MADVGSENVPGSLQHASSRRQSSGPMGTQAFAQQESPAASESPLSAEGSQSGNRRARRMRQFGSSPQPGTPMAQGTPERCALATPLATMMQHAQIEQSPDSAQPRGSRQSSTSTPLAMMQQGQTDQSPAAAQPSSSRRSGSKQRYPQYLPSDVVGQGLKKGTLIRATIRINAQDRTQAFATVPGLPSDLMIRVRPHSTDADLHAQG